MSGVWKTAMGNGACFRASNHELLALEDFRRYCPNTVKLDISLPPVREKCEIVDVCVSYGKKLKALVLTGCRVGAEDLRKICRDCPSVRIGLAEIDGLYPILCFSAYRQGLGRD